MDMKKSLCAIMAALLLLSCQEEELCTSPTPIEKPISEHIYAIPVDSALANLAAFMADEETSTTRSAAARVVSSVTPIKYSPKMTRSTGANVDCENLLYVANFENEQGYAILAADTRIGDEILAVVDEGSLSEATVCAVMDMVEEEERIIYEDYPLTGPGFFTLPETGDELYMNPNTVNLYDQTVDDTLVGNFSSGTEENDSLVFVNPPLQPGLIPTALCVSYALNSIGDEGPYEKTPVPGDQTIDGEGGSSVTITTETTTSNWGVKENVYPILTKYVRWSQGEPFNDLCPLRTKYLILGERKKSPAGCFPLAIAKLMAYFEYPVVVHDGYTVDWNVLNETSGSYATSEGKKSAAHLLKEIGEKCYSLYFYSGTFTFPCFATSYMKSIGFDDAESYNYDFNRVKEMLDNASPVIVYSVPGINLKLSHSWNIDGYKTQERIVTTKTYRNGVFVETTTKTESREMVHCDFGLGGNSNGYYVSGVFKLGDPSVEKDHGTVHDKDINYNNYLHVVTYDKP